MAEQPTDTQVLQNPGDASAPANFGNKSPFSKKAKQKDPTGNTIMMVGIIALIACLAVIAVSFLMSA